MQPQQTPDPNQPNAPASEPQTPETPPAPVQPTPVSAPPEPAVTPAAPGIVVGGSGYAAPVTPAATPAAAPAPAGGGRSKLKKALFVLLAVAIVAGGAAAAYVGIIVPNKPENVLKAAIINTLQEKQISSEGTSEGGPVTGGGLAYKVTFSGTEDSVAKTAQSKLSATVSGVTFPVEARLVNKNVYLKLGDISTITNLLGGTLSTFDPNLPKVADSLSQQVSNKWIVIDDTIINETGAGCVLDNSWGFTKADLQLLENQYVKSPFVKIQSSAGDKVDSQKATKLVLSIDDDKAAAYANNNNLNNLSLIKSLNKCFPNATKSSTNDIKGDHSKTPLTIWVDKAHKRIVQVAWQTTPSQAKKANAKANVIFKLFYTKQTVQTPSNATPALQLLGQIEKTLQSDPTLQPLISGSGSTGSTNSSLFQ